MSKAKTLPTSLIEAVRYLEDVDVATEFVAKLRWPDGPECPRCGSGEYSYLTTRRVWKCKGCKKQYTVKLGTIFGDSPLGLDKWLPAVWLIANSKNGISSHELGRALGVTQKSAWFMLHRIRLAMQTGSFDKLDGEVEVDESYVGGRAKNMHASKRENIGTGRATRNKTAMVGLLERGSQVRAAVVDDITRKTLHGHIRREVKPGSTVYTDSYLSYRGIDREGYEHRVIDHAVAYVDGKIHTNGLENFWSLVKRGLSGTYVSVEAKHLGRYLDERVFTFNERERSDYGRFEAVLRAVAGRRMTYAELTGKA